MHVGVMSLSLVASTIDIYQSVDGQITKVSSKNLPGIIYEENLDVLEGLLAHGEPGYPLYLYGLETIPDAELSRKISAYCDYAKERVLGCTIISPAEQAALSQRAVAYTEHEDLPIVDISSYNVVFSNASQATEFSLDREELAACIPATTTLFGMHGHGNFPECAVLLNRVSTAFKEFLDSANLAKLALVGLSADSLGDLKKAALIACDRNASSGCLHSVLAYKVEKAITERRIDHFVAPVDWSLGSALAHFGEGLETRSSPPLRSAAALLTVIACLVWRISRRTSRTDHSIELQDIER